MKNFKNRQNGITLVALVITIIILLILAGVAIVSLNNSGLFDKTRQAEERYKVKQEDENIKLEGYETEISKYLDGNGESNKTKATVSIQGELTDITEENISSKIGTQVDYHPTGDSTGVYRIFFLDVNGKYGDGKNTLYLKRDYDSSLKYSISYNSTKTATNDEKTMMAKMNPLWNSNDGVIDSSNEKDAAALYNTTTYSTYCDSNNAKYAIGSPSIEMYIDAYNQWKGTTNSLNYKFVSGEHGYSVGANGEYTNNGNATNDLTVQSGTGNVFATSDGLILLASPSRLETDGIYNRLFSAGGMISNITHDTNVERRICPIVALNN